MSLNEGKGLGHSGLPLVAVILLNYKGYEDTVACMESLVAMNYPNLRIYLVDNASPDQSGIKLTTYIEGNQKFSEVEFYLLEQNLGFAGGNNVAIRQALEEGAELVWLLNNDTLVRNDTLQHLVDALVDSPAAGIAGSKIYFHESRKIWYAGGDISLIGSCSHRGDCEVDEDGTLYNEIQETTYLTGCSMLIRREVLEQAGLLDEQFFLYYEDVEFCLRVRRHGWSILYNPKSILWHKVSVSTGGQYRDHSPIVDYYDTRNRILFVRKCYRSFGAILPTMGAYLYFLKKHIRIALRPETNKLSKLVHIYLGIQHGIKGKYGVLTRP